MLDNTAWLAVGAPIHPFQMCLGLVLQRDFLLCTFPVLDDETLKHIRPCVMFLKQHKTQSTLFWMTVCQQLPLPLRQLDSHWPCLCLPS